MRSKYLANKCYIARNQSQSLGYISAADSMGLFSFKFLWWAPKTNYIFSNRVRNCRSRSSKVIHFTTNWKCVCNFLLVINSKSWSYLATFQRYCSFSVKNSHPTLLHPNLGDVLLALDHRSWGSKDWTLILEETQPDLHSHHCMHMQRLR